MTRTIRALSSRFRLAGILGLFLLGNVPAHAGLFGYSFPGASAEELALESPKLDPEAPAEYLERRIRVIDRDGQRTIDYYTRIKVFNEAGVEAFHEFELETWESSRVRRVKAQVTLPDGTTQESERDSIYSREVWRHGSSRGSRTSIAVPGVRPGAIVELHYQEDADDNFGNFWVYSQRVYPTHLLSVEVRFHEYSQGGYTYTGISSDAVKSRGGVTSFTLEDLPSATYEEFQPPKSALMPWILIYYLPTYLHGEITEFYWENLAKEIWRWEDKHTDARDRRVRAKAEALTAGLDNDTDRLRAIYNFCTKEIQNVYSDVANFSAREIEEMKMPDDPAETLEFGYGSSTDRFSLFLSLVRASGFETKLALCNDRALMLFNPKVTNYSTVPDFLAAVRRKETDPWQFFDLYYSHLPFGRLRWTNCGTSALLSNRRREVEFVETPRESAADNETRRFGIFKMNTEGDLEGVVRLVYTGQVAFRWRHRLDHETDSEREDSFRDYLESLFADFTLTDFEISHLLEPEEPLQIQFNLELPAYGMAAGSRLFFSPEVFEPDGNATFDSPNRVHDVMFPYPWQVQDKVQITYPEGFSWSDDTPSGGIGDYDSLNHLLRYWHDAEKRKFTVQRLFSIETAGFRADAYETIKKIFDQINEYDRFPLTLRKIEETATP